MSNFITDDMVSAALDYLAQDPHPVAIARGDLTRAENRMKEVRSRCFLAESGSVEARKAGADIAPDYLKACDEFADANQSFEAARARMRWAETAIDVWRTANANARAAERVR